MLLNALQVDCANFECKENIGHLNVQKNSQKDIVFV